jgi:hypothetical protein
LHDALGDGNYNLGNRNFKVVQLLVEHCDLSIVNMFGRTYLDIAGTDEIRRLISEEIEYRKQLLVKEPDCY